MDARFDDLTVLEDVRIGEARDEMRALVEFDAVGALAVIDAEGDHAVIAGAFKIVLDEIPKEMPHFLRRIIEEQTDVAFVLTAAVDGVGAIERQTILRRLQILEAVGNLRLAGADAELLVLVEVDVGVEVANLARNCRAR